MTTQQMITTIRDNLGDRTSGRIGSRAIDTVILEAINIGVPHLVQEAQPDYYNRTATLTIETGTKEYDLPTTDDDGSSIRIKDIYAVKGYRSGGTPHTFTHLNYQEFIERTAGLMQDVEGVPCLFALWGRTNKLHLDFVPTEDYSMVMFVESYPTTITSSQLGTTLPIDDQWSLVLESFSTAYCYLKLQQVEMYAIWNDLYLKQKDSVSRTENDKQAHNISASGTRRSVNDPLTNPFQRSFNG